MLKYLLFFFLTTTAAHAHPVIYQGGWALSSSNMPELSDNYALYSFTNRFAAGVNQWRLGEKQLGLVKLNHLLWRHNGDGEQANIYLHAGAGKGAREVYVSGAEADWETRELFTAVKHYQFTTPGLMDFSMSQARVGFSPRLADFKSLQTWVMLQGMYTPDLDRTVSVTPILRFFYHNILWEMGSSTRGEWLLNFMVHY